MKPDEVEKISHGLKQSAGDRTLRDSLMQSLDAQMKAVQDFASGPSVTAGVQLTFLADLRQLVGSTAIDHAVAKQYVERLMQPKDQDVGGPDAKQLMWQEQAAPELAVVQIFGHQNETTLDDVRQTATRLAAQLPVLLDNIKDRMTEAPEAERFQLKKERVALQEEVAHYERTVKVLDHAFPQEERLKWQTELLAAMAKQPLPDLAPLTPEQRAKFDTLDRGIPVMGVPSPNSITMEKLRADHALQLAQLDALRGTIFQAATFTTLDQLFPGHTKEAIQASKAVGDLAKAVGGTIGRGVDYPTPLGGGRTSTFDRPRDDR